MPANSSSANDNDRATNANDNEHSTLKWSDKHFIRKVAEGNQKEIAFAQLAAQQASNPEVKSFAEHIARDHERLSQDLAQLAQQKGVTLEHMSTEYPAGGTGAGTAGNPMPNNSTADRTTNTNDRMATTTPSGADLGWSGDHQYKRLAKQNGQNFDREFLDMMVDDHESTIKTFEKKASDADDPDVRAFATQHLPTLREHLQQAQNLQKSSSSS